MNIIRHFLDFKIRYKKPFFTYYKVSSIADNLCILVVYIIYEKHNTVCDIFIITQDCK